MIDEKAASYYRKVMRDAAASGCPFLVGGAYALRVHTGIVRDTKDLDLFVHPRDMEAIVRHLAAAGHATKIVAPHWLGKVGREEEGDAFVDLICSSRNGIARVDAAWFAHAHPARVFDTDVKVIPPEEMIWSKAFILERERFDGADIAHLLRHRGRTFDWRRLLDRFGDEHATVLYCHLLLFRFIFPAEKEAVPDEVERELAARVAASWAAMNGGGDRVCRGTLLNTRAYRDVVREEGYRDARLEPIGSLRPEDIDDQE
jgi:hypothetical protein